MAEFTFEARARGGQLNTGTLTAGSEREAMERIREILDVTPEPAPAVAVPLEAE